MKAFPKLLLAGLASGLVPVAAHSADMRAAPVVIEPQAGARTSTFTLINDEDRPLKVQVRVMRWSMVDGKEVLTPTTDVVASPPLASLKARQRYLVRLVRTAKAPPVGEENYRVLVDEVPDPNDVKPGAVQLVLRLSIPLFFSDEPRRTAKVDWNVVRDGSGTWLTARNTGTRRLRLADLTLESGGKTLYRQPGLVGYVLAGETNRWQLPATLPADGKVEMKATADTGPVDVPLVARTGA
jgi:fimbrial chaperone protein